MIRLNFSACGFAILAASMVSLAQPPATAPSGLDSLTDDRLISELASRGLTSLLDRAFEANHVPPAQRDGMRALIALRQLSDAHLTANQRRALVQKIAAGIETALPSLTEPRDLTAQAKALLDYGVERDANTLEYWGENPRTQQTLRPVVEAVVKLLDKASAEAQKRADALANQITSPSDVRAKQWEQLANLSTEAQYKRNQVDYYRALTLDRLSPERMRVADDAIKYLQQYDNPESGVQPEVRLRLGKLRMARSEFDVAKEMFASVMESAPGSTATSKPLAPPPDVEQQWQARYFSAVCDLLSQKPIDAQKGLDALVPWQQANLPKDTSTQERVAAAASMLQYRIYSLSAEIAGDDASKKVANAKALAVLLDLVKKRPGLQSIIFEQLLNRLPADADLKTLDPLLLQGFVVRADEERQKPQNEKADEAALSRGVEASREILRRRKTESIDPQLASNDALLLGFFLQRLHHPAEAAEAMLDFVEQFGGDAGNATIALENAMAIIGKLRSDPATADLPATVHAYDRFLPIAIGPPFSRREFAYEYARRLQLAGRAKEAVDFFRLVPPDDKRLPSARFYEMVALQQRLDDEPLAPPQRQQIAGELAKLMEEVRSRVSAALAAASSDQEKLQYRSMLVRTTLQAADAARREQNDPKRTLELLANFEQIARGLPNEKDLIGNVLYTRVQAYMALGDTNAATAALVSLLQTKPGGEGAGIVIRLLQRLNKELDQARLAGDRARMQTLARNRAKLSGFLVDWAKSNPDPNIKKFTYRYSVVDANTKQQAAELEDDPAARKAGFEAALKLYRQLESPESLALYHATLDANAAERNDADPAVSLGIGLIAFNLGDYAEAQKRLGPLLTERKLGTPETTVEENGQPRQVPNDQYWEATLKLMRSNLALASTNPNDSPAQAAKQETINYLKQLFIRYGRDIGGKKWSGDFEKLRQELIPDFNPDTLPAASEPVSTPTTLP